MNPQLFDTLRRMKGYRQVETAELMASMNNFTLGCAKAILAATRRDDPARPDRPKAIAGVTTEQMAGMEREIGKLNQDYRGIEATFGDDVPQLVLASRHLGRLIETAHVAAYPESRHSGIVGGFSTIVAATSLDAS